MCEESPSNKSDKCPLLQKCPFFNDLEGKCRNLEKKLKQAYCLGDNTRCARYYLRDLLGKEHVPPTMMPQQWDWANLILTDAGMPHAGRAPEEMRLTLPNVD